MTISFSAAAKAPASAVVVLGVFADRTDSRPADLDWVAIEARGFASKLAQVQFVEGASKDRTGLTAIVGLGDSAELDLNGIRRIGVALGRALRKHAVIATPMLEDLPNGLVAAAAAQCLAEGVVLGAYGFEKYKSDATPALLKKVVLVGSSARAWGPAAVRGAAIADAVCWARDLVNEPGGTLTPPELAKVAAAKARRVGLTVRVHTEAAIERMRLGGLLGVNRGSTNPPRLVEVIYEPTGRPTGTLALVGKGITFDSGGLSLKTGPGMMTMKCDMAGAAAVFGAMIALATVKPRARVHAWVPITDNMPSGDAVRPGDVLRIRNGKTVEVLNTDAEGRLVLADALSLASETKPDAIVDLATLTGACMVALGSSIAGLMSNNDEWSATVRAAADTVGERVWPLPLPADYKKQLDSPVADMKNIGGAYGGSLTAGLFLQEFVAADIPWAHLDIAGPAFLEAEDADHPRGGTGFGVRLLVELAQNFVPA
ncbi:MAG: leucyl aminopeptidase [Actinobacteria bacterium]|uniref:leucyl aminopeptidase n=1 Tax=freshwater metagenome TaxID=449393 RepID=A0A6J6T8Q8_9ZZZZ|nr:leucyl aminopeptidase [Actinomycetota bacterium]MSW91653.1 leucyl aminopeptidase [Actinomycetota bacterium]MSX87104.1 leucyl aminopeptidase [Actinomycetota bacterium]MSY71648.1 leucyl aminopeptidase [Actinomycetota bacterium]